MKPSETENLYSRLGIPKESSPEKIKTAYRSMAMKWHPDKHPGHEIEAKKEFNAISEAYEILKDGVSRGKYDNGLHLDVPDKEDIDEQFKRYDEIFKEHRDVFMGIDESEIDDPLLKTFVEIMKIHLE